MDTIVWNMKHATFPTFLQNHQDSPDFDRADAEELELTLRRSVLYCRGLVIADSDLNNNEALHAVARLPDTIFWPALRAGFVRRAARLDEAGNRVPQRDIAQNLLRTNPDFYHITDDYLVALEKAIDFAENRERADSTLPLWTPSEVSEASILRLIAMLGKKAQDASLPDRTRDAFRAVRAWVRTRRATGDPYSAAALQKVFGKRFADADWIRVWKVVTGGHGGNIALTFRGDLPTTSTPETNDWFLPGGPESEGEEGDVEEELYGGADADPDLSVSIELRQGGIQVDQGFEWRNERLVAMTFEELVDLRENAEPEAVMDLRFKAAASGTRHAGTEQVLIEKALDYHEQLYRSGRVLTNLATYAGVRDEAPGLLDSLHARAVVRDRSARANEVGSYLVQASTPLPLLGRTQAMLDFYTLGKLLGKAALDAILARSKSLQVIYKRPDYRVLERLAAQDV